jgi:hypothetical protein
LLTLEQQVLQRLCRTVWEVLAPLVQLQQFPQPVLCLAHWELAFFLQDKAAALAVHLPMVQVVESSTPQLDYSYPVGLAAAAAQQA